MNCAVCACMLCDCAVVCTFVCMYVVQMCGCVYICVHVCCVTVQLCAHKTSGYGMVSILATGA